MATNKDSFNQLIARVKHDNGPQKMFVRRNILNEENSDTLCKDHFAENDSAIEDDQRTELVLLNSINVIEDSNSNTSCPLQTYFGENTMNFLTVELGSSSNDSTDQCASNDEPQTSNHLYKTSLDSFNSINPENVKTEKLSFESVLIHEEITSNIQSRQSDVLENEMDIDTKKSISEFIKMETENREHTTLSKRSRSVLATNYGSYSEFRDKQQKELRNEDLDSIVKDVEHFVEDSDNIEIQDNYGK